MKALHVSSYYGDYSRHGGTKRSEQINQVLLENYDVKLLSLIELKKNKWKLFKNPLFLLISFYYSFILSVKVGLSMKGFLYLTYFGFFSLLEIRREKYNVVFLEITSDVSIPLSRLFFMFDINCILFPHNIEFMVPEGCGKDLFLRDAYMMSCEIDAYKSCTKVYTISDYDTSILRCFNINAETFPYFPPDKDVLFFDQVRKNRSKNSDRSEKDNLLLLGSAINPPTYIGMTKFLDDVKKFSEEYKDLFVEVAGYGTDKLGSYKSKNVDVLGAISDEELYEKLSKCSAALVVQPQTTGFLTKIVELNLSGVPVIVLSDYFQAKGLEEYNVFCLDTLSSVKSMNFSSCPLYFSSLVIDEIH